MQQLRSRAIADYGAVITSQPRTAWRCYVWPAPVCVRRGSLFLIAVAQVRHVGWDWVVGTRDAAFAGPRSHDVGSIERLALAVVHHQTYPPDRRLITRSESLGLGSAGALEGRRSWPGRSSEDGGDDG
jgi:hypothetical protein